MTLTTTQQVGKSHLKHNNFVSVHIAHINRIARPPHPPPTPTPSNEFELLEPRHDFPLLDEVVFDFFELIKESLILMSV